MSSKRAHKQVTIQSQDSKYPALAEAFEINPQTGIAEHIMMKRYLNEILNTTHIDEQIHSVFSNPKLDFINKSIRNKNYYGLDKYGLIIRSAEKNSGKTAFGWKLDQYGDPVNYHINDNMLLTNDDNILRITLQTLKNSGKFSKLFQPKNEKTHAGIIRKIYEEIMPEINLDKF